MNILIKQHVSIGIHSAYTASIHHPDRWCWWTPLASPHHVWACSENPGPQKTLDKMWSIFKARAPHLIGGVLTRGRDWPRSLCLHPSVSTRYRGYGARALVTGAFLLTSSLWMAFKSRQKNASNIHNPASINKRYLLVELEEMCAIISGNKERHRPGEKRAMGSGSMFQNCWVSLAWLREEQLLSGFSAGDFYFVNPGSMSNTVFT